jgi:hypothetical protein
MQPFNLISAAGQVAAHLRAAVARGEYSGMMPGVNRLGVELGVNPKTVESALQQLEREGLLVGQGAGRKRLIVPPGGKGPRPMRVAILLGEPSDRHLEYIVELQHALAAAGHAAIFPAKSLMELGMNVGRVGRLVRGTTADAWVVLAGSREMLEWFCTQPKPAFALFGRRIGLPIAATGPDNPPAFAAATHRLIELGHRRISLVVRRLGGQPEPGQCESVFLDKLKAHGIPTSEYNLPDWRETKEGLQDLLSSLFRVSPPSALIIDAAPLFTAAQQFLARRDLRVPAQVSLICTDPDPTFAWCVPSIAHIRWDSQPLVCRIVRWVAAVGRGERDLRQTSVRAEFVAGGTIGPAPAGG